jgi:dTDP-glucose 4,6-dehydratase
MPKLLPPPIDDLDHCLQLVGASRWEQLRDKRIFLTGGTGFVGKWLLATLLHADRALGLNCHVTVLTRSLSRLDEISDISRAGKRLSGLIGDVRSFETPDRFDVLVHAATDVASTPSPLATFDTCVRGTERVLELATRTRTGMLLLLSSGAVYGPQPSDMERISETYSGAPSTLSLHAAYAEGKRAAEWLTMAHASHGSFKATVARCFAFVGPYLPLDRQFAIGNFIRDALSGQPIHVRGDGSAIRSYMHATDLAAWLWTILISGSSGCAYNVGGAESISIADLARRVAATCGGPQDVVVAQAPTLGRPAERYVPNISKARQAFDLPDPMGLDISIQRTVRWLRAR